MRLLIAVMFQLLVWGCFALCVLSLFSCVGCAPVPPPATHLISTVPPGESVHDQMQRRASELIEMMAGKKGGITPFDTSVPLDIVIKSFEASTADYVRASVMVAEVSGKRPVRVILDGTGGLVTQGFATLEILAHTDVKVTCFVREFAGSMNAWVFAACPGKRIMNQGAILVLHKPHIEKPKDPEHAAATEWELLSSLCYMTWVRAGGAIDQGECIGVVDHAPGNTIMFRAVSALRYGLVDELRYYKP